MVHRFISYLCFYLLTCLWHLPASAQFIEQFDQPVPGEPATPAGWSYATGDGTATMKFLQHDGYASVYVDARADKRNIWWALVRRPVPGLNIQKLMKQEYELRVEARIRVSHAPRRVNLHFNHQRTTDFHSHLMEYDIPDTVNWHTISMTTRDFEVQPGDQVNAQMALMDWGLGQYRVDIDYFKVDIVDRNTIGKDLGAKMPYHPPVADPEGFAQHIPVIQDAVINTEYPELNFNDWQTQDENGKIRLLAVNGTQIVILRWDLSAFRGKKVHGSGLLELTTHSIQRSPAYEKDFGMVRVVEILGGDPDWEQGVVTYDSFCAGQPFTRVLNTQMVIDYPVPESRGNKALFTINQSALQRMVDGRTLGLAIRPLGAVHAAFYAMEEEDGKWSAQLHFDLETDSRGR
jgi:hypothetical protein